MAMRCGVTRNPRERSCGAYSAEHVMFCTNARTCNKNIGQYSTPRSSQVREIPSAVGGPAGRPAVALGFPFELHDGVQVWLALHRVQAQGPGVPVESIICRTAAEVEGVEIDIAVRPYSRVR